ncbi:MAG: hypothetical protein FJ266_05290 [Planctomycetes bacterium]|nr:hypothetical protein [Planctomycetota bacterium]
MVRDMREFVISVLCLILFPIYLFTGTPECNILAAESRSNPHELKEQFDSGECGICHRQTPERIPANDTRLVLPGQDDFVTDPVTMCVPCHEGSMDSHPIAVQPKYLVPADLPLDKRRRISCLTCHYAHGSLKSNHTCCSMSFLDRMFDRKRMKKSFLLRRENTNGELCNACHVNNV